MALRAEAVLIPGTAEGRLLRLEKAISFWGGIEAESGRITDPRHPQYGASVAGRVLALPGTIGSSSSSAVLLELIANRHAPAALLLAEPDAILALGVIVAQEMAVGSIPVLRLSAAKQARLPDGGYVRITQDGRIEAAA